MRKPSSSALLVALALSLTTACGSTVANQGLPVAGGPIATADQGLGVDQGGTGTTAEVPGEPGVTSGGPSNETVGGTTTTGGPAGSSGGSTGAAGGSSTSGSTGGSGSAAGGAAVTGPIKIGLFSTDFGKAAAAIGGEGSSNNQTSTTADGLWKRLIPVLNKSGGAGGRKIESVSYVQDGTSNNYPADYAAACEYFARDEKVAVVLAASIPDIDFASCLLKAGIPTIQVNHYGPDRARWSRVPGLLQPSGVSLDAAGVTIVDAMVDAGVLVRGKSKVGVILSECPYVQQVYRDVLAPRLKKHGIGVDAYTANECIQGFGGVGAVGTGASSAVLRFKTNGVTHVMPLLASLENLMTGLFAQAAENQEYRPGYLLSTNARAEEIKQGGTVPANQFKNMKGVGWIPTYDLFNMGVKVSPQGQACLAMGKEAGFVPSTPVERAGLIFLCDGLTYLDAVLTKSRGASGGQAFVAAARSITDYVSAQTPGQPGDFRDIDNVEFGQVFSADSGCNCIKYTGKTVRIAP